MKVFTAEMMRVLAKKNYPTKQLKRIMKKIKTAAKSGLYTYDILPEEYSNIDADDLYEFLTKNGYIMETQWRYWYYRSMLIRIYWKEEVKE